MARVPNCPDGNSRLMLFDPTCARTTEVEESAAPPLECRKVSRTVEERLYPSFPRQRVEMFTALPLEVGCYASLHPPALNRGSIVVAGRGPAKSCAMPTIVDSSEASPWW